MRLSDDTLEVQMHNISTRCSACGLVVHNSTLVRTGIKSIPLTVYKANCIAHVYCVLLDHRSVVVAKNSTIRRSVFTFSQVETYSIGIEISEIYLCLVSLHWGLGDKLLLKPFLLHRQRDNMSLAGRM